MIGGQLKKILHVTGATKHRLEGQLEAKGMELFFLNSCKASTKSQKWKNKMLYNFKTCLIQKNLLMLYNCSEKFPWLSEIIFSAQAGLHLGLRLSRQGLRRGRGLWALRPPDGAVDPLKGHGLKHRRLDDVG